MATTARITSLPFSFEQLGKRDVRTQFAALPYRFGKSGLKVLLVTSRDTGRWVIPKGWPIDGVSPARSAEIEAWEEAGVKGKISERCAGIYTYNKELDTGILLPVVVAVFPLEVRTMEGNYPERTQRERRWCSPKKAARRVQEPELQMLLRHFLG